MKINKQKLFEIVLTALISAGIAFLQNILTHFTGFDAPSNSPETAGMLGGAISYIRNIRNIS